MPAEDTPRQKKLASNPDSLDSTADKSSRSGCMSSRNFGCACPVGQGEPARRSGWAVDPDLFSTLGARPALGRLLLASDDLAGAGRGGPERWGVGRAVRGGGWGSPAPI